jgi:predicted nuclease with TOPRIM domain
MNELTNSISDLKLKVESLVDLHKNVSEENKRLKTENENLTNKINEQQKTIAAIQEEQKKIIENKSEEQNKVITDSKFKIDELVQEIDNCLALLK